jgi:sulfide:quinone oxidoreductase
MTVSDARPPLEVVIAGAGVAGLEALLGLHDLAGDHVHVTLVDPADNFLLRPMTVAVPFSVGHATRYPLADLLHRTGAQHVRSAVASVDPAAHVVITTDGEQLPYDALVLALGADARPPSDRALTFDPQNPDQLSGLLRDAEEGYAKRIAIVIPPEPHWTLPAYELALLLARDVHGMGMDDVELTLVTPEERPLALFGTAASAAVEADLAASGIRVEAGGYAELRPGHPTTVLLRPSGRTFDVDRVLTLPGIRPREIAGMPRGREGFLDVDEHSRVNGVADVYAAGDGTSFPVKHGGIATQQADAAVHHIAARAGAPVPATPFVGVLHGRLITGSQERWMRRAMTGAPADGEVAEHALWWPPGKVAGRWLAPYLAEIDDAAAGFAHPPGAPHDGVEVAAPAGSGARIPRGLELLGRKN